MKSEKSEQPKRSEYGFAEAGAQDSKVKQGWTRIRHLFSDLWTWDLEVRNAKQKVVLNLPLLAVLVGCLLAPAVAVLAFISGFVLRYRMHLVRRHAA